MWQHMLGNNVIIRPQYVYIYIYTKTQIYSGMLSLIHTQSTTGDLKARCMTKTDKSEGDH